MARTFQEIKTSIINIKNTYTSLNTLTSSSNTAIWNLIIAVVASAIAIEEQLLDLFKADIKTSLANNIVGTKNWLATKTKEFQFDQLTQTGGLLVVDENYAINYSTNFATLITGVSVVENDRVITIRVAKGSQPFIKLTSTELNALKSYIKQIQFAGQFITVVSLEPDKLFINLDVTFDGTFGESNIKNAIKTAINLSLSNSEFDGIIKIQELTDVIQAVNGVKDINIKKLYLREDLIPVTSNSVTKLIDLINGYPTIINTTCQMKAGYAILETTTGGYEFDDNITMIAV